MTNSELDSPKSGYAKVNGIRMYYEIHGQGMPLVLIHGGGSTIESNFELLIPSLSKNHQIIAVELQAHGHTTDRNSDLSFEQDADDVAALLAYLNIDKADVLGFSNGATTSIQLAIRHPKVVNKMVLCSPLAKRNGVPDQFWDWMNNASLENMPIELQEAFLKVNPDSVALRTMHDRDAKRMVNFKDISDEQIQSIQSPALIIIGDHDIIKPDHAQELQKLMVNSRLEIVSGAHGDYFGDVVGRVDSKNEQELVALPFITEFLKN